MAIAAGITLLKGTVPATPATDKVTIYVDDVTGEPSYVDDTGTTATLVGAPGAAGPPGADGADGSDGMDGADGVDGVDGRTVLNGSGAPGGDTGVDGDFYIDTSAAAIYGPKTAGVWGSGTSLIGPTGATGATGAIGATGATGPTGRVPSVQAVTSSTTVTPTFSDDLVKVTAQAAALFFANPTGTAIPGLGMVLRVKDNGTARAITYDTQYRAVGVTLPTTTVIGKTTYIAMIYNSDDTKWDVIAVGTEA